MATWVHFRRGLLAAALLVQPTLPADELEPIELVPCLDAGVQARLRPFAPWSVENIPETLSIAQWKAEDFLSPRLLDAVRARLGPVGISVRQRHVFMGGNWVEVSARAGPHKIFSFIFKKYNDGKVLIQDLVVENPLPSMRAAKDAVTPPLRGEQRKKGLPLVESLYLRDRIFAFLRAGGCTRLQASASQYLVNVGYRRFLGMKPGSESSARYLERLDRAYQLLHGLPIEDRVQSLDDFSQMIGNVLPTARTRFTHETLETAWVTSSLRDFQNGVPLPPRLVPVYDADGTLIAIRDREIGARMPFYYVVKPDGKGIFHWDQDSQWGLMSLSLELGVAR
jgi:hypothetical protein